MYSARAWGYRVELHSREWWPLPAVWLAAGVLLWLTASGTRTAVPDGIYACSRQVAGAAIGLVLVLVLVLVLALALGWCTQWLLR